jgi:Cys-rich repeat protein
MRQMMNKVVLCWCAALVALLGAVGCDNDPAEEMTTPMQTCELDLDCRVNEQCVDGICREATDRCTDDVDCGRGEICEVSICRTGCRDNSACTREEFCDPVTSTCEPLEEMEVCRPGLCPDGEVCNTNTGECEPEPEPECRADGDCAEGEVCVAERCVVPEPECRTDAGCDPGEVCEEGACVPGPECEVDLACGAGRICEGGACVEGCREDSQCPTGQFCDADVCTEGCRDDVSCGEGMICKDNACVEGCRGELDCGEGFYCDAGSCVAGCRGDLACGEGMICEQNACVAGCRDDRGCAEDEVCAQGQCEEACAGDGDCGPDQICRARQCRDGCREDAQCGEGRICLADVCVEGCREDNQCGDGEICQSNTCRAGCRDDMGCEEGEVCLNNACRTGCRADGDCGEGEVCLDNVCAQGCRRDSECGEGEACRENVCVAVEACDDDPLEDNDLLEDASPLPLEGPLEGYICPGDEDVFVVQAQQGCALRATVRFTHSVGDLDLELLGTDGMQLDESDGTNNSETVQHTISATGRYYVVVYGFNSESRGQGQGDYTLEASLSNCPAPPLMCPGDDPREEDDTREAASALAPGAVAEGIVCGEDEDWFQVSAPEGCAMSVELLYEAMDGNLSLALFDADGMALGMSDGDTDQEVVALDETQEATYFVRVTGDEEARSLYLLQARLSGCAGSTGRVLLSEVFYDPDSGDTGKEWVELYNDSNQAVDLSGFALGAAGGDYTHIKVQLRGMIPPGGCFVLGGPQSNAANGSPQYDQVVDFWNIQQGGLQNGGTSGADGVALFAVPADMVRDDTTPADAFLYGGTNSNDLLDETGAPGDVDLRSVPSGQSGERTRAGWRVQADPSPGDCAALQSF